MPIYEYECLQCNKRTEWLQRMSDGPLAACPQCGGEVRKLISAPSFQFKGSGFYKTDYADKKSGGSGNSGGKSESKSEGKSEAKSESASETKSESKPESKSEISSTATSSESKSTVTKTSE
jgi:putative FmdB family regulatory protein